MEDIDLSNFDAAAWAIEEEKKFYTDINSTEINLAYKFRKATDYVMLWSLTDPKLDNDRLQKYIFVLEDGFKILTQNDDDSFAKLFEFLRSAQEVDAVFFISDLYDYITKLTLLYQKAGDIEKAKMKFKKIAKFCLLSVSRYKVSGKYMTIRTTCQHLESHMSDIKKLDMMNEILDDIVKIMKTCEKDKPRDFGHFRLLKGHMMKELGKHKESLSEYEKAQDIFRKLVFNWIDKKGKKSKDESVLRAVNQIAEDYKRSEQHIFRFWKEKGEHMKAIKVYERYVKKNEIITMFVMSMEPESDQDTFDKRFLPKRRGLEERLELGRCYFEVKNYPMSLLHFKKVIEEDCRAIEDQIFYYKMSYRLPPGYEHTARLHFHGKFTKLPDLNTFDLLDMVISCQEKLDFEQGIQEKTDIYLTPDMELIWQKETSKTEDPMHKDHDHFEDLLNATVTLCMKTYWTQIHRVNLNEFYYKHLQKIALDQDKTKVLEFSLNVIDKLKSQTNKSYLPEFYPVVYLRYIDYKCYDEAMDTLMEWLDYKERDFDWNFKMIHCLSNKIDYKEVEPYLIDCLQMVVSGTYPVNNEWDFFEYFALFRATTKLIFYQKMNLYPVNPLFHYFFHSVINRPNPTDLELKITFDAKVLYDYVHGTFIQNISSYEMEGFLTVKLVKLATLLLEKKYVIIDIVKHFEGVEGFKIKPCLFQGIWTNLFNSEYSIRSLQDEVLKALMENYDCLNESQENIRLFANSCFLTRCLKNKAIS